MRELLFNISGQKLEKNENCNFDDIVMNSNNYLKLLFDFDASWKGSRKAIKLTNGKDKEVNLLIKGNSTQETTTGKNLLEPYGSFPKTSSNITFDLKEDGFHINGKCSGNNSYIPIYSNTLQPGTYYVNGITGGSNSSYQLVVFKNDTIMSYVTYNNFKITLSESSTIKLQLYVYSSYGTFNDLVLPYMICKNESELTTYEPYTGGQPSPSPEYPQEVTGVDKILATFKGNKSTLTKSLNHTLLKPLYRLGKNVYDYIDFNKGKIIRNVGVVTFDGSSDEQWQFASNRAKIDISNMKSLIYNDGHVYFCDKFKYNKNVYSDTSTEDGLEVDYILIGAYEASIYDTSANTYLKQDEQVADFDKDLLCSISNVKPCSGLTQNLTSANVEKLAKNRGEGWHSTSIKDISMGQLLMIIELGTMNTQNVISKGVVSIADNGSYNCAVQTGSTSSLGNVTGRATTSIGYKGEDRTEYTGESQTSISFRGVENFWGNMWKLIEGLRFWGNTHCLGGQPYVCKDFNYTENKMSDNYEAVGFTLPNSNGYIKAMGYDNNFDWLFIPSKVGGNSSKPVGDSLWIVQTLNKYIVPMVGGHWTDGLDSGGLCLACTSWTSRKGRDFGGRLVYIPNLKNW